MSWTAPGIQNFVAIGSGVSAPQIRDFEGTNKYVRFFGFFNKVTAYTRELTFTKNRPTSKKRCSGKEVPFGGHDDYI